MSKNRIQIFIALALLVLSASTLSPSFAANGDAHAAANASAQSCFRIPAFTPVAGEWAWRSHQVCILAPVFE